MRRLKKLSVSALVSTVYPAGLGLRRLNRFMSGSTVLRCLNGFPNFWTNYCVCLCLFGRWSVQSSSQFDCVAEPEASHSDWRRSFDCKIFHYNARSNVLFVVVGHIFILWSTSYRPGSGDTFELNFMSVNSLPHTLVVHFWRWLKLPIRNKKENTTKKMLLETNLPLVSFY